jgi:hypothetical protein
MLAEDSL